MYKLAYCYQKVKLASTCMCNGIYYHVSDWKYVDKFEVFIFPLLTGILFGALVLMLASPNIKIIIFVFHRLISLCLVQGFHRLAFWQFLPTKPCLDPQKLEARAHSDAYMINPN